MHAAPLREGRRVQVFFAPGRWCINASGRQASRRTVARTWLPLLIVPIVAAGCSPSDQTDVSGDPSEEFIATSEPSEPSELPSVDLPPVDEQFVAFVGGGDPTPCDELWWEFFFTPPTTPYFGPADPEDNVELGQITYFCSIGFSSDTPVSVSATSPDGSTIDFIAEIADRYQETTVDPLQGQQLMGRITSDYDQSARFRWLFPTIHETGTYRFEATQDDASTRYEVEVTYASSPTIDPFPENQLPLESGTARFALRGFPPGRVPIAVYRETPGEGSEQMGRLFTLHRKLDSIVADSDGTASIELDIEDFPPGDYCLASPLFENSNCYSYGLGFTVLE